MNFFVYCAYFAQEPTRTFSVRRPLQQFSGRSHACLIVAASVISHTVTVKQMQDMYQLICNHFTVMFKIRSLLAMSLVGPPGEGNSNPLQYSCLENPMDRGSQQATVHGVAQSWTRLSDFAFTLIGPVLRTLCFHCRGCGFHPGREVRSHMLFNSQKNKK